ATHASHERGEVSVPPDLLHLHLVPRRGALLPEPAGPRVKPGPAGLPRAGPRFLVEVGDHQHLAGRGVLDHGRHQPPGEVRGQRAHLRISSPRPASSSLTEAIETSPKWKIEAARAASAPPTVRA